MAAGTPESGPTLIFLCVANSARSQMAEGLARASAPAGWQAFSAGSRPGLVHPAAIQVMQELGIDISGHRSKGLDAVPVEGADVIVTLCAEEECPVAASRARRLYWPVSDPVDQGDTVRDRLAPFRSARDEIRSRLDAFWREIAS